MRFVSVRELRNHPGEVWKRLAESDLVLTANGKPRGILLGVEEDELEELLDTLRQARATRALTRIRERAAAADLDRLPPDAIEREIAASRSGVPG